VLSRQGCNRDALQLQTAWHRAMIEGYTYTWGIQ